MNKIHEWINTGLIVLVAILVMVGGTSTIGRGRTNYDTVQVSGLVVGTTTSATNISTIQTGACNLIGTDASQAASTTAAYDCAVTGVLPTDNVLIMIGTSTLSRLGASAGVGASMNWVYSAAKASTTAGYITVLLTNNGTAAVPSAFGVGSSSPYIVTRTQTSDRGN